MVYLNYTYVYELNDAFESLPAEETVEDSFNCTVTDSNGNPDVATVCIKVEGLNDPPFAVDDRYSYIAVQ